MEELQMRLLQLVSCSKAMLYQYLTNISGLLAALRD